MSGTLTGGAPENSDQAATGVFQSTGRPGHAGLQGGNTARGVISFMPSLSSVIYGASSTVMPASVDTQMGLYLGRPA